jgi:hypothetical protein
MARPTSRKFHFGDRFGWLVIDGVSDPQRREITCRCQCGKTVGVKTYDLLRKPKGTESCGCKPRKGTLEPGVAARNKVLHRQKQGAQERDLEWTLTDEEWEILTADSCTYCGVPPQRKRCISKNGSFIYNGIDRVDNLIGYTSENVVTCCKECNWAKGTMTAEEFLAWRKRIAQHL